MSQVESREAVQADALRGRGAAGEGPEQAQQARGDHSALRRHPRRPGRARPEDQPARTHAPGNQLLPTCWLISRLEWIDEWIDGLMGRLFQTL